jgi:hypothetical protein
VIVDAVLAMINTANGKQKSSSRKIIDPITALQAGVQRQGTGAGWTAPDDYRSWARPAASALPVNLKLAQAPPAAILAVHRAGDGSVEGTAVQISNRR